MISLHIEHNVDVTTKDVIWNVGCNENPQVFTGAIVVKDSERFIDGFDSPIGIGEVAKIVDAVYKLGFDAAKKRYDTGNTDYIGMDFQTRFRE